MSSTNPTKVKIEDQEDHFKPNTECNFDEIREEESQLSTAQKQSKFEPNNSTSTLNRSLANKGVNKFSRRIDELKRQQAKLDKIKSEKDQLQAFLEYQNEMEREKERKLIEEQRQMEILYHQKAIIIQKYARVWLAKRVLLALQEAEYQKHKELLNQALDEMRDQIRV